uniref:antibiotic biosynthesis monooxygenase family protein n=1 Tax=Thaumasiovibrio occultus TaxID=1891184 RepID=UPI000B361C83|nr:antibiotic biosynthesis monooxygenase [Thaumasiovibrio occultus]
MYAVIFKAKTGQQDAQYSQMVSIMRDLAFEQYNCQDFIAVTEGNQEIAISYWQNEDDILRWHQNAQHAVAQQLGREKWYASYTVEVVKIERRYTFGESI